MLCARTKDDDLQSQMKVVSLVDAFPPTSVAK